MITPVLQDEALLADVEAARQGEPLALHLWWLGQSGFLLLHDGRQLLFDPYLSDSLTAKYADTDKPHVRMTARVIDPLRLDGVAVITSSHTHTDHLDRDTLLALLATNPTAVLVLPEVNRQFAADRLGIDAATLVGLPEGATADVAGFRLSTVPAAHEEVTPATVGFIVRVGPWCLYHAGDTLWFDGIEDHLRRHAIDVALLPINGRAASRRVAGNLDGREAAELARAIDVGVAVPCHYEMFAFNTASPDLFVETCHRLGQRYARLRAGERLTIQHPPAWRLPS